MVEGEQEEVETEQESQKRLLRIKALATKLFESPDAETKELADLAILVAEDNMAVTFAVVRRLKEFVKINHLRDAISDKVIQYMLRLNQRIDKLENSPAMPDMQLKELSDQIRAQQEQFEQHKQTLEDIEAWSRGRVLRWFRDRFGGE